MPLNRKDIYWKKSELFQVLVEFFLVLKFCLLFNHKCKSPQKKVEEDKREFILRDTEWNLDFLELQYNCYLGETTLKLNAITVIPGKR